MPYRKIVCKKNDSLVYVDVEQDDLPRIGANRGVKTKNFYCDEMDNCPLVDQCEAWRIDYW